MNNKITKKMNKLLDNFNEVLSLIAVLRDATDFNSETKPKYGDLLILIELILTKMHDNVELFDKSLNEI